MALIRRVLVFVVNGLFLVVVFNRFFIRYLSLYVYCVVNMDFNVQNTP